MNSNINIWEGINQVIENVNELFSPFTDEVKIDRCQTSKCGHLETWAHSSSANAKWPTKEGIKGDGCKRTEPEKRNSTHRQTVWQSLRSSSPLTCAVPHTAQWQTSVTQGRLGGGGVSVFSYKNKDHQMPFTLSRWTPFINYLHALGAVFFL